MKVCVDHWQMMRDAIDERGMSGLVAKDGEAAHENVVKELEGNKPDFDPLMSMHWHWANNALRAGGLYLMGPNPDDPQGHYCPVCEYQKNVEGFDAKKEIGIVADQMRDHCIAEKLIPAPS